MGKNLNVNFAFQLFGLEEAPLRDVSDWKYIPKKYRNSDNYEMFVYFTRWGCDALSMFMEKITELEKKSIK